MQKTIQYIKSELGTYYPDTEIQGFVRLILESVLFLTYTDIVLQKDKTVSADELATIKELVTKLKKYEPIQYILGETEFYDLRLTVSPAVLIPRPETEELVHWIIHSEIAPAARILDVGTGSGCIALAIKNELGGADLTAVDISENALEIAKNNAARNNLDVNFIQADILSWRNYNWPQFDVVVSNPPYVRELEKEMMDDNVLRYEPKGALFVENENPLVFYRTISEFALVNLKKGGCLFFEINEYLGKEMVALVKAMGFSNIELRKDLNGRDRMLACRK